MVYYYAYSGHKVGLERVKRATAILKRLQSEGVEVCLLVNDFRAGLAAREFGINAYITIETILDIDAVAEADDTIIIDSSEAYQGKIAYYCTHFKQVFRMPESSTDRAYDKEGMIDIFSAEEVSLALVIDHTYFEATPKQERTLFFLDDMDHDKCILSQKEFFNSVEMELLLGHYFFVKYETALSKLFTHLHEPEEYTTTIKESMRVVTSSTQTALEACASGARVVYLDLKRETLYPLSLLEAYGIIIVEGFDLKGLRDALSMEQSLPAKPLKSIDNALLTSLLA